MKRGPTCVDLAATLNEWPDCITPDCQNKACLSIGSPFCFPCSAVNALRHQIHRPHPYRPERCTGCKLAALVLDLKGIKS
jgi:hypothetical protein